MKQPIRNVVFDLGGVLVDLEMERVREAFRAIGMPRMADLMDPCYPAEVNERMESGAIDFHAACDEMRRIDRRPEVTDRQIYDVYAAFLARIDPAKLRAIDRLRAGGIRTYVLSNTNPAAFEIIRNLFAAQGRRMEDAFDGIGLSFRMKDTETSDEWDLYEGGVETLEDGSYCARLTYNKKQLPEKCVLEAYDCWEKEIFGHIELSKAK